MYRIQKREFSSNIIEKKVQGKDKWIPFLAPLIRKVEGDKVVEKILKQLNNENYIP